MMKVIKDCQEVKENLGTQKTAGAETTGAETGEINQTKWNRLDENTESVKHIAS